MASDGNNFSGEILHDFSPIYRVYNDGGVERLMNSEKVPPSRDSATGVRSKDVVIDSDILSSARIYLPPEAVPGEKRPLVIYFHGGAFAAESAFGNLYHTHLNRLTATSNVVAVSVEYRLAPEHPLPAAYDDAWSAVEWIDSGSDGEEWISSFADLNRAFIAGDSAGGNIAHYVALRAGIDRPESVNPIGAILNCPFFSGEKTLDLEPEKEFFDRLLGNVWADSVGLNDPRIDPSKDSNISKFRPNKALIFTAENDFMRARCVAYKQTMVESEWEGEIEIVDTEGEVHIHSLLAPNSENGIAFFDKVSSFING